MSPTKPIPRMMKSCGFVDCSPCSSWRWLSSRPRLRLPGCSAGCSPLILLRNFWKSARFLTAMCGFQISWEGVNDWHYHILSEDRCTALRRNSEWEYVYRCRRTNAVECSSSAHCSDSSLHSRPRRSRRPAYSWATLELID